MLKGQIPIRTFSDWDDTAPGFAQADLVAHDDGDARGEYCQTLTITDVATGWTEARALKNKARRWVIEANGAEFINHHLVYYCDENQITFTRGRPYRVNDSCYVEQKNWAVVRQAVGYARYDTDPELKALAELYSHLRLMTNFFCPQAKLASKTREGARVIRRYDRPATPCQRLVASGVLNDAQAQKLHQTYLALNPAQLRRDITRCQRDLRGSARSRSRAA